MHKTFKTVLSVILLGAMILSIASCFDLPITADGFESVLRRADIGADDSNIHRYAEPNGNYEIVNYQVDLKIDYYISCFVYKDDSSAEKDFQREYERYRKIIEADALDGVSKEDVNGSFKYFTMDGTTTKKELKTTVGGYKYGGWYCTKHAYLHVYAVIDDDEHREKIDKILKQLNYPTP